MFSTPTSRSPDSSPPPDQGQDHEGNPDPVRKPPESESQEELKARRTSNRSLGRVVHIFDAADWETLIGGLRVTASITNKLFHQMLEIIIIFQSIFAVEYGDGTIIKKDDSEVMPGSTTFMLIVEPFEMTSEAPLLRTKSLDTGPRLEAFRDAIRQRDKRCLVTGEKCEAGEVEGNWVGFQVSHVFPLAYEDHWKDNNFSRWISIVPETGGTINSVQNGMLLRDDIHTKFDLYDFAINPADDYKIIPFSRFTLGIAGNKMDHMFRDDPQGPVDELLAWRFRQAVLVNMKGATFEVDFPPGSDVVREILQGPKPGERMQFELFSRMAANNML